jgi:hypothetical protein
MTGVTYPDNSTATFEYNGDGLRVRKAEAGVARNYLLDGARVYGEHDANMNEVARYITTGPSYGDALVAIRWSGAWYYPLYDRLGSVRRVVDVNQSAVGQYWYDAFGNVTSQSEAFPNPYKYVGALGYWSGDSTTGLQHLGARHLTASCRCFQWPAAAGDGLHVTNHDEHEGEKTRKRPHRRGAGASGND